MDIQALRSLIELQAIQSINTTGTSSSTNSSDSTFSTLLNEILGDYSNKLENLGQVASTADTASADKQTVASYIQSLTLNGNVQVPQNVLDAITKWTSESTTQTASSTASTTPVMSTIQAGSSTISHNYEEIVKRASLKYGVPEKLISSIIKHESNFDNSVKSRAGAVGLMQLMPATAQYVGVTDRTNPEQNIMGGTKYISLMLKKYDGDLRLALAAYNAGPGNVDKYGGVPPFKETQNYLKKVLGTYQS